MYYMYLVFTHLAVGSTSGASDFRSVSAIGGHVALPENFANTGEFRVLVPTYVYSHTQRDIEEQSFKIPNAAGVIVCRTQPRNLIPTLASSPNW
jgi:hypothetical protein